MNLYSTNSPQKFVDLKTAVLEALPPDNGLYMPEHIPQLPATFFEKIEEKSLPALAFDVSKCLLQGGISDDELKEIVDEALTFDAPVVAVTEEIGMLELFHGPTLAFKDFGARFMARMMGHFVKEEKGELTILVATSGDTGGAVANGFFKTPGTRVVVLYPSGKVSFLQEKQLTALGENILALEIEGDFDACQAMVKQAFLDPELRNHLRLTSANSINIARLIPQTFYYFWAWQQLKKKGKKLVFCVPSGNLGNVTAGLIAKRMGLPIEHFIIATNINNSVPVYLEKGVFPEKTTVPTISNAMDISKPSNFVRILELYGNDWQKIKADISGYYFSDEETRKAIRRINREENYLLDPHAAVGFLAMEAYQKAHPEVYGVVLGTAHPAKFLDVVEEETGKKVEVPEALARLANKEKVATYMPADFTAFKDYLMKLK